MAASASAEARLRGAMVPVAHRVVSRAQETADTWTLELEPLGQRIRPRAGQFDMLYAFGVGEVPISTSGDHDGDGPLTHTIRAVGAVTRALCALEPGAVVGVRGPFGTEWPLDEATGGDLVVVAGGIGLAPLRPALHHLLAHRGRYGRVSLLYGVPLFQPLRRPLVEQLAAKLEQRRVEAGDVVVREGDVGDLFYVIESGALDARHDGRLLTHMSAGDHFGEIALLRDVPRTATVVATEDSVLQTIQREDFLAALTGDEELRGRTESVAARRLANT